MPKYFSGKIIPTGQYEGFQYFTTDTGCFMVPLNKCKVTRHGLEHTLEAAVADIEIISGDIQGNLDLPESAEPIKYESLKFVDNQTTARVNLGVGGLIDDRSPKDSPLSVFQKKQRKAVNDAKSVIVEIFFVLVAVAFIDLPAVRLVFEAAGKDAPYALGNIFVFVSGAAGVVLIVLWVVFRVLSHVEDSTKGD